MANSVPNDQLTGILFTFNKALKYTNMKYLLIIPLCICLFTAGTVQAQTVVPPAQPTDSILNQKDHTYYRDPVKDTSVTTQKKNTTDSMDRRKKTKKASSNTTPAK
jgi:hypothetical protein